MQPVKKESNCIMNVTLLKEDGRTDADKTNFGNEWQKGTIHKQSTVVDKIIYNGNTG